MSKTTYHLLFSRTDEGFESVKGFNHVDIAIERKGQLILVEPVYCRGSITIFDDLMIDSDVTVVTLTVRDKTKSDFMRLMVGSCATMAQYVIGVDLKAILAQTLYNKLLKLSSLDKLRRGISELTIKEGEAWVLKPR